MNFLSGSTPLICTLLLTITSADGQEQERSADLGHVFKVDDTGTIVLDPVLEMRSQSPGRTRPSPLVSATTRVSVQLNLGSWIGRSGRIYMTLPRTTGPTVHSSWEAGGTFLPGTLLSGERALVYAGPITSSQMRDLIDITLHADGGSLAQPEALVFGFEIELDQ